MYQVWYKVGHLICYQIWTQNSDPKLEGAGRKWNLGWLTAKVNSTFAALTIQQGPKGIPPRAPPSQNQGWV